MTADVKVMAGAPEDPLPKDQADVLLYYRLDGSVLIRWFGYWIELSRGLNAIDSIRGGLAANVWTNIAFRGSYTIIPNYAITCHGIADINREVYYEIRNVTVTGMEIKVPEACKMQLNVFRLQSETTL